MALLFLEEDPWLTEYESCEKLYKDIMERISIRKMYPRKSGKYSELSATIRLCLKQYYNEVGQLKSKLEIITRSGNITLAESERRTRQIEILSSKGTQMNSMFQEHGDLREEDRQQLIGISNSDYTAPSTSDSVIGNTSSVVDLKENQIRMLDDQDRELGNLSGIISRQKNIAHAISNEVDVHNDILDNLGNVMDQTDERVRTETTHITVIDNKDKTCVYWVVIILLFISIIIVAVI